MPSHPMLDNPNVSSENRSYTAQSNDVYLTSSQSSHMLDQYANMSTNTGIHSQHHSSHTVPLYTSGPTQGYSGYQDLQATYDALPTSIHTLQTDYALTYQYQYDQYNVSSANTSPSVGAVVDVNHDFADQNTSYVLSSVTTLAGLDSSNVWFGTV